MAKDLTVYKIFNRANGSLVTPYQYTKAKYGETMVANGKLPSLPDDYSKNTIKEGVIHSYIYSGFSPMEGNCLVKATIKARTPFFVSFDGSEIASRELLLDNEESDVYSDDVKNTLSATRETIINFLRDNEKIGNNNIKVGDVLLSDKSYVAPGDINGKNCKKAIGIVGFIREDGTPHIISLKQKVRKWSEKSSTETVNFVRSFDESVKDFNGKEYTKKLHGKYEDSLSDFPALDYCLRYKTEGTNEGEWFFPSTGEILQTVRNTLIINRTVDILNEKSNKGIANKIVIKSYYWASAENYQAGAWGCSTNYALCDYWNAKWYSNYVRPSLANNPFSAG